MKHPRIIRDRELMNIYRWIYTKRHITIKYRKRLYRAYRREVRKVGR